MHILTIGHIIGRVQSILRRIVLHSIGHSIAIAIGLLLEHISASLISIDVIIELIRSAQIRQNQCVIISIRSGSIGRGPLICLKCIAIIVRGSVAVIARLCIGRRYFVQF